MWKVSYKTCLAPWLPTLLVRAKRSACLLLVSALSACATLAISQNNLLVKIEKSGEGRNVMAGSVKFTQESEKGSVTLPGTLLLQWPHSARLEVQDPFGGVQLLLIIQGEEFWLYRSDWRENVRGKVKEFGRLSALPVRGEEFLPVFLARPIMKGWKLEEEELRGPLRERIRWDSRYQVDTWSFSMGEAGQAEVRYLDWIAQAGVLYPTKIQFSWKRAGGDRKVQVQWDDWKPDLPSRPDLFSIPPKQSFGKPTKALPDR